MYDLKDIITSTVVDPYKYLASPLFNLPGRTCNHKLVLVAVCMHYTEEIYKSETLLDNHLLQSCIEGVEPAAKYIIDQKISEFKQYLAKHGEQTDFEVTVYLNNEIINKITVDSGYI